MITFAQFLENHGGITSKMLNRNLNTYYTKRERARATDYTCPNCQYKFSVPKWMDTQLYCPKCRKPVETQWVDVK